ncbi:MAG TPA: hypothetical protein VEG39_12945 [Clostridia bacterium]|nr:hypothetical protein [Clostridia bacterium]
MNSNESIIMKWKLQHEKGIFAYVIPYALRFLAAITATTVAVFLFTHPDDLKVMVTVTANNMVMCVMITLFRVAEWFKKEREYKKILDLFEAATKCPACSAKAFPEDKVCASCGTFLSMDK